MIVGFGVLRNKHIRMCSPFPFSSLRSQRFQEQFHINLQFCDVNMLAMPISFFCLKLYNNDSRHNAK